MNKTSAFLDPGKILEFAERRLTGLSLLLEKRVEKYLRQRHRKDKIRDAVKKREKQRRRENKEIAKYQDFLLDQKQRDLNFRPNRANQPQTQERLQEIDDLEIDESLDAEVDKD